MPEPWEISPDGAVTVVNATSWASRPQALASLLLAAGGQPEHSRVVPDPGGSSGPPELALVADPTYWSQDVAALGEVLATPHPEHGGAQTAAGAAPAGVERLTLTVEEAAAMLGVSRAGAYEAVQRGEIPSIRIGRRILVPKGALHRLVDGVADAPPVDGESG